MENTAANNRLLMPETAKLVDQLREVFGADVKVLYAKEGAIERGSPIGGVSVPVLTYNQELPAIQIEVVKVVNQPTAKQKLQQKKADALQAMVDAGQIKLGSN
jgi:hypothetical protein